VEAVIKGTGQMGKTRRSRKRMNIVGTISYDIPYQYPLDDLGCHGWVMENERQIVRDYERHIWSLHLRMSDCGIC